MKTKSMMIALCMAGGMVAAQQAAPPEPPASPRPAAAPQPPVTPQAVGSGQDWESMATQLTLEQQQQIEDMKQNALEMAQQAREKAELDRKEATVFRGPLAAQVMRPLRLARGNSSDGLYDRGRRELDQHYWDQAVATFNEVAARAGAHSDGALYWKAYALNKLGRRDEASATIADLNKTYPNSRWLDDAKALDVEMKQAAGGNVAPESQNDDEIKLLALNGLMQSDPERAFPLLEKLLKSANSPHLKDQAVFVLAQSSIPKAQQLLVQIARGGGNPDLQLTAIRYLGAVNRGMGRLGSSGQQGNNNQVLFEIYNSSNDAAVKREILNALAAARDKAHLLEIAHNEKAQDLRLEAIRMLGATATPDEMWQLYQTESSPEAKQQILAGMTGNSDRLIEVARNEKDPKLRRAAILYLGSVKGQNVSDALVALYSPGLDTEMRRAIVNSLYRQRNAKAMIDVGRKEKDMDLRTEIVRRLTEMKTPEAEAFLEEILK
jgi:TolA-binding protein